MKEFLKTNTVTYNLMSFTGFKSILIFSLLVESPKSYKDLQEYLKNHKYLQESVSIDTLRIYLNSLREIGCKINKTVVDGITRYSIDSHPFELKFSEKQIKSILKVYKVISKSIDVSDLISLQEFFEKISQYIDNEDLKNKLKNISPLTNISSELIENLIKYVQNNAEITIYYNSPNSGYKNITLVADKLSITNNKLYLSGFNSESMSYSSFLVSRVIKIVGVNIQNKTLDTSKITVGYEYRADSDETFELLNCEEIIKQEENLFVIEISSKNKFEITQRILSHTNKCKVLYPEDFKNHIVASLKKMKEGYIE